jgi:hypothetical protein
MDQFERLQIDRCERQGGKFLIESGLCEHLAQRPDAGGSFGMHARPMLFVQGRDVTDCHVGAAQRKKNEQSGSDDYTDFQRDPHLVRPEHPSQREAGTPEIVQKNVFCDRFNKDFRQDFRKSGLQPMKEREKD